MVKAISSPILFLEDAISMDDETIQTIKDIISAGNKIEYYLRRIDFDSFRVNRLTIDYVLIHLDRISRAAATVPVDVQQQFSKVKWTQLTTLRGDVTGADGQVDVEALWTLAKKTLPRLQKGVGKALRELTV